MSYNHLSLEERYYVEVEKRAEKSINKIALALGRSQSCIYNDKGQSY